MMGARNTSLAACAVQAALLFSAVFGVACEADLDATYTEEVFHCERALHQLEACCGVDILHSDVCEQSERHYDSGLGFCGALRQDERRVELASADAICLADAECDAIEAAGLCSSGPRWVERIEPTCDDAGVCSADRSVETAMAFEESMGALCN